MTLRAVFIADGSSDLPLADHLGELCLERGVEVTIATPDPARLNARSRSVSDRLEAVKRLRDPIDVAFVHRDAEAQPPHARRAEIEAGAIRAGFSATVVPVIPVRMTEAWLVLDEAAVRSVAGRPNSSEALGLPTWRQAETIADPKATLRDALVRASGTSGRRRDQFIRDFDRHRSTLLTRLDRSGLVSRLSSWQQLVSDIELWIDSL